MFKTFVTTLTVASLLYSEVSVAENTYLGLSLTALDYTQDSLFDDASLTAIIIRGGYEFNKYFSSELRVGFGVGEADESVSGIEIKDIGLKHLVGGFVIAQYPASELVDFYVSLGYTDIEIEDTRLGITRDSSDNDVSYGVGFDLNARENVTLNFEFTNYFDKEGDEIIGYNFGLIHYF